MRKILKSSGEKIAKDVRAWIRAVGAKTAFIGRWSPWKNSYVESFNATLRDELPSF